MGVGKNESQKVAKTVGSSAGKAIDVASTPELMAQAAAAGLSNMSNRWVFDKTSGLNFYRDDKKQGITYCWNEDQDYMHRWISRGKMEFLWAGRNPLPGAPKPPPRKDENGSQKEVAKPKEATLK